MNLPSTTNGETGTNLVLGGQNPRSFGYAPGPSMPPIDSHTLTLSDYWRILLKRRWYVLCPLVLALVLGAVISLRAVRVYEAMTRLAINRESSDFLPGKDGMSNSSDDADPTVALETQVNVLESDNLALQVIHDLQLDKRKEFGGNPRAAAPTGGNIAPASLDNAREAALLAQFHSNLKVRSIPNTRLVEMRFRSTDPKLAAEIANDLTKAYIEQNVRSKYDSTMQAADWLSKQLADLQIKVETSQEKLVQYQREHEILGLDEKQNITTQKLDALNSQLTQAETDRVQKETAYRLAASDPNTNTVPPGSLLSKLRDQEADLKNQYAQASVQFGPNYPKTSEISARLKQVEASIEAEQKHNVRLAEMEYKASAQRVVLLRAALDNQKQELNKLNESAIEYNLLKRDADSNRQIYEGMLQKMKEAGIEAGLKSSNIRVVDAARVPLAPVSPDIPRNLEIALLLGVVSGMALALGAEAMDQTVRMPADVELNSQWPSLGIIPQNSLLPATRGAANKSLPAVTGKSASVLTARPNSEVAESYRSLRTAILLSNATAPPKVILVTSALPQEGKTTTIVNLAVAFAQQGRRILLVDADLRRPAIHKAVNTPTGNGLSAVLDSGADVQPTAPIPNLPNLHVMTAGRQRGNAAELLSSPRMLQAIETWRNQYDHIFIDTPPALSVTDAVVLSVWSDTVVVVVRSGVTSKAALRRVRSLLDHVNANVLGAVLNAVDLRSPDYYYYYYSGSKYGSYYHDRAE